MKTKNNMIFNTGLIYFIILTLFVGVRICTALNLFSFLGDSQAIILTVLVQVGFLLLLPLFLSSKLNKKTANETLQDFNFKKTDFKTVLISILIGLIVFILTVVISSFFSFVLGLFGYVPAGTGSSSAAPTWESFVISIIIVAILPAICEEFTHRGLLISGLKTLGIKKAIIYSSLLFGLLHLNIEQFFYASIIGAVLGAVSIFSRSIVPAMIIHFINNAINVYLDFARVKGLPGGDLFSKANAFLSQGNFVLSVIFVIISVFLLVILLLYLIKILLAINAKQSIQDYAEKMTIEQMRNHVLGKEPETPTNQIIINKNIIKNTVKINIPYEILGFYMTPQVAPTKLDTLFIYSSILLSGLITIFTFVWGIL
jgi:membrane protease YdiL (CAAX protease family)